MWMMEISTWLVWSWKFWLTVLVLRQVALHLKRAVRRSANKDRIQYGLGIERERTIHSPDDTFDIVAVHGFVGAKAQLTWSAKRAGSRVHWLQDRDFLPKKFPEATIMAFSHCTDYTYQDPSFSARENGIKLLQQIRERRETEKAPIILIGHSYGGIVIKEAVIEAYRSKDFRDVREAIIGLIFLGTPHFGSMWSAPALLILGWVGFLLASNTWLLQYMAFENPALQDLHSRFIRECGEEDAELDLWRNSSGFVELRPKPLLAGLFSVGSIVGRTSASGGLLDVAILDKDHSGLVKFSDSNDMDFHQICEAIKKQKKSKRADRYNLMTSTEKAAELATNSPHDRDKIDMASGTAREAHIDPSLHDAISPGLAQDVISDHVASDTSVDERNQVYATPLQVATRNGNLTVVKMLLGAGADPNARDDLGRTPLHEAVLRNSEELVRTLLEAGADSE